MDDRRHPAERARTIVLAASIAGVVGLTGGFAVEAAMANRSGASNSTTTTGATGAPDDSFTQNPTYDFGRNFGGGSAVPSRPNAGGGGFDTRSAGS